MVKSFFFSLSLSLGVFFLAKGNSLLYLSSLCGVAAICSALLRVSLFSWSRSALLT